MRRIIIVILSGIVLAGCNQSTTKKEPSKYVIEIKEMRFEPAELHIQVGDTVEWVNHDIVAHDITELDNKDWSSSLLNNGQSWKHVINNTTNYYCSIHQVMKGHIIVGN